MTLAELKMPCNEPNCKHGHSMTVNLEELGLKPMETPPLATVTKIQEIQQHEHTHDETPKTDPHEELSKMLPKGVNFGKCANGSCGTLIKNAKGLTTKFKACTNCKANTVPKSNDYCPTCGKKPKEDEEWDESDVDLEDEEE